jgi:hypothetical protein
VRESLLCFQDAFPPRRNTHPFFPRDRGEGSWHGGRVTTTEAIQLLEKFRAGGAGRDEVLRLLQGPLVNGSERLQFGGPEKTINTPMVVLDLF